MSLSGQQSRQESGVGQYLSEMGTTLMELSEAALAHATAKGAEGAKVVTATSFQKRLVVEGGRFSLANSLESRSLAVAVHKHGKKGSASINTVSTASAKGAIDAALAMAEYSVADPSLVLPTLAEAPRAEDLPFQYDAAMESVDLAGMERIMSRALSRLLEDSRVALDRFEMSIDLSWHGLVNSHGVRQEARQSMASWSYFGMAREGDEVSGFDYDGDFSFGAADLEARALKGAEAFVGKVTSLLRPRRCPSYRGQVLLTPRAVHDLLLGIALYHAGGRQVMDGKSLWEKDVGRQVMSSAISLRDLPRDRRFSGATAYDGDGLPTRTQAVIEDGILTRHLHDCYSARRTGAHSTATAGGPFALSMAPGTMTLSALRGATSPLLVVDRFSGNTDPVKGDFSGVAKGSRLVEQGQDLGAVTETMIAGNFFEIAREVHGVSRETEVVSGGYEAPYVLIGGVSVTGD